VENTRGLGVDLIAGRFWVEGYREVQMGRTKVRKEEGEKKKKNGNKGVCNEELFNLGP